MHRRTFLAMPAALLVGRPEGRHYVQQGRSAGLQASFNLHHIEGARMLRAANQYLREEPMEFMFPYIADKSRWPHKPDVQ